ncbi:Rha family transcriptional regulator [Campylobacter upsaliensis]|nr:Rha family transcriptional regulator [Campylobacter upsaliensis]
MSFLHSLIINDCEVKFSANENKTFCTSLDIARVFGKRHDHVLRDIENLLKDLREIGASNELLNFGEVVRISKTTNPKSGKLVNRKMPMYKITRDGFSLLAMGFTGKKALQWKIAFIDAFNTMEKLLQKEIYSPNKYLTDLMRQIYPNLPQDDYEINVLITNKPHTREAKNIFSLNYLVDNRTPKDPNTNLTLSFQTRKINFQTRKIKSPKEKK